MKDTLELTPETHKPVHLRDGNDSAIATRLRGLVRDAEDGLRRMLVAGAFIDGLVEQLPHGQLDRWLQQHVPDLPARTVRHWRTLYRNLLESVGAKRQHVAAISGGSVELLAAPIESLPEEAREIRAKIDAQIAGKTARQLFLEFKSADADDDGNLHIKVGRRKGEGGRSPDPAESKDLSRVLALRAEQHLGRALKELNLAAEDWPHMSDEKLRLFLANLEVWSKAVRKWLDTTPGKRGPEVIAAVQKTLAGK
jgi:hypothetical protein